MLSIGELSAQVGLPAQTIRYYERVGLLPPPQRAANRYRRYELQDSQRLRFIRGARALDFSLDEIREILDLRDRGIAPCRVLMGQMARQIEAIADRIKELERLRGELTRLHARGRSMPEDVQMKACVCHLIEGGSEGSDDGKSA